MKIIRKLVELMEEELEDAEKYAWCAINHAEEHPELAQVFATLSREEMHHKDMLHAQAARIIEKHRMEHGEPPPQMLAIYNYMHEKFIKRAHEIEMLQDKMKR